MSIIGVYIKVTMSFIDVFCGAGGFTEGFKMAGWKHIVGIEWDKHAASTYAANHEGDVIVKDARLVTIADLNPFLIKNNRGSKSIDAIIGSPPCTSFSSAGPRIIGDERDDLYREVIRLAALLKPKFVVIENVIGMLTKTDPQRNNQSFVNLVIKDLNAIGYFCEYQVLSAMQFGLPQSRRRVIFVACRDKRKIRFPIVDKVDPRSVPVRKVLEPPQRVAAKFFLSPQKIDYFANREFTRYIDLDKAAPTIRATYFKSQGEHGLVRYDDGRVRKLTDKEIARIQGFPKSYVFLGSLTQIYKQIGNAVAPPMGKAIALALHDR